MDPLQVSVVHIAGDPAGQTLNGTVQVLAQLGLHQVTVPLKPGPLLARLRALEEELAALALERSLYALHLHGSQACLLGSRALRGSLLRARLPSTTRVLFSPQLRHSGSWKGALIGQLLKAELAPLHDGVLIASPGEAHVVSCLLERSAEVLPPAVDPVFFQLQRQEAARPAVLAGGSGTESIDGVSRLAVLLNSRQDRVPIAWLGSIDRAPAAQLQAAGVQICDAQDEAGAARLLSSASAYLHLSRTTSRVLPLAQAMAAGVPCLTTDTLAHRAMVRHADTGFICASDLDFVEKLIVLLRDPAERERIGQAGRAEAARMFTQRHFETAVLRAYGFNRVTLLPRQSVNVA